jgi:hypothetical protein
VLNEELAPWRDTRRICLARNESSICVHLEPEQEPPRLFETCSEAEASDDWTLRVRDAQASI